ncbi:hypothetical protein AcW1_007316 [Taiwanofungus camphoratus]|nr:hypothetical protein AcW2_007614 [Antrodia cinnamomea]KAI0927436.1 hypothetical protein AcV5_007978 [Antrodia cinnamomea]KAI0952982.1 hypothetical protein AcW1_007316 [Antrodia cinnamomea]
MAVQELGWLRAGNQVAGSASARFLTYGLGPLSANVESSEDGLQERASATGYWLQRSPACGPRGISTPGKKTGSKRSSIVIFCQVLSEGCSSDPRTHRCSCNVDLGGVALLGGGRPACRVSRSEIQKLVCVTVLS